MDENDGPKDGGTGKIGFRHSTDATACQAPPQPGIPAWMLARNNSVHAPVSGRPSAQKSTSRKPPSMPLTLHRTADSYLAPKLASKTGACNVTSEPKALPPPPKPSPSVDLDALNDDQALALLLKNETVAGLLQNAFNTRVEENQQKLVRAYNQRLLELEEYTRSWRDATKEIWSALSEGTLKPNNDQRQILLWKGPQEVGSRFDPDLPSTPQEVVEKEVDSDGRVSCISIKVSSSSQSRSHFNRQEWIDSNACGSGNFKSVGNKLRSFMTIEHGPRLLFRHKHDDGNIECRPFTSVTSTIRNVSKGDVIIEITPSNVALMGKAFCYLKDTNDRLLPQRNTDFGTDISAAELAFLYDRFSQEPTKRHLDVLSLQVSKKKFNFALFAADTDISVIPKRLLIARPCYAGTDGSINGVKFFDVGSDTHTTRQDNGEEIVLLEDKLAFNRLALLLCWCIKQCIVPVSLGLNSPVPSLRKVSFEAGLASTSLQGDQEMHHSPACYVSCLEQNDELREWTTDIKGSPADFVSESFKILLFMRSPYLPGQQFSKFLETVPSCGRIFFRLRSSPQDFTFFSFKGNKYMDSPVWQRLDVMVDFSIQNVLLFWKTFCILKDRNSYLLSQVAGPLSEVSRKACDILHEKLAQHFRDSLPPKKKENLIQSVSLPLKYSNNGWIYDGKAEGKQINRRLVIARPYHQGNRVIGAEFFDTASGARKARVSTDIVLTEDTATLMDIGHLLEQVMLEGMLPFIKQDRTTRTPIPTEFPHSKAQVSPPQMPHAEESEQSGKTVAVARSFTKTCMALHDMGLGQQDMSAVLKNLASPQPSLFQRTLALSDGLKELRDEMCHDQPDPQTQNQWLAIGGEPEDVRSLSPSLEQDSPTDNQSQASGAKAEVLPFEPTNQGILQDPLGDSEKSDLIMLDGQPKNITFCRREKHLLPIVDQEVQRAKRPKLSTPEPSTGVDEQLLENASYGSAHQGSSKLRIQPFERTTTKEPAQEHCQVLPTTGIRAQSLHLGKRDSAEAFNPLPPPSAITTRELRKLRKQLRRLGNRLQDSVDQVQENTIGGEIEEIEKLRNDIERFEGVLEAQREIEERQDVSKNLRPRSHPPSLDVSDQHKPSSNCFHQPSAEPEGVTDTQMVLTGQGKNTPMEGAQYFPSVHEITAPETSAAPKRFPCTVTTEPKILRGLPTEPRALTIAIPSLQDCLWPYLAGTRAISVGPIAQHQTSQIESSSNSTPNQVDAANGLAHNNNTAPQIDTDHLQSLRAVVSSPLPPCEHEPR